MKVKTILILSLLVACTATPCLSKDLKTELILFKSIENYREIIAKGRLCNTSVHIRKNKDISSLSDMRNRFCKGEYSLSLNGPAGTTVTLYGQYFFGKGRGYLVLTKTDDYQVRISNIDDFPGEHWVVSQSNEDTGGYEAFFKPSPDFKTNLASIQWDKIP
jgi:hypothetical protein